MFLKTVKYKHFQVMLTALLLSSTLSVFASKHDTHVKELSSTSLTTEANDPVTIESTANSFVALDFAKTTAESWGRKGQQENMVSHCINGDSITGFEYTDVTIETVGNSFFSEARINFSDSNGGANDINLTIGSNNENFGVAVFNSDDISDITDSGNVDVISLADKKFIMEFHENIDDQQGEIDARYTSGILKVWGVNLTSTQDCPFTSQGNGTGSDLSLVYNHTATAPSQIGDSVSFNIVVTNSGADEATAVILDNSLSPNLEFALLTCDDGTSASNTDPIISINLNNIPAGNTLSCILSANIVSFGTIKNAVNIAASNDLDVTNNSASIVIAGANAIVPINNYLALLVLMFGLLFFTRKFTKV